MLPTNVSAIQVELQFEGPSRDLSKTPRSRGRRTSRPYRTRHAPSGLAMEGQGANPASPGHAWLSQDTQQSTPHLPGAREFAALADQEPVGLSLPTESVTLLLRQRPRLFRPLRSRWPPGH